MKRRTFIQHSALAGLGALAMTRCKLTAKGFTDFGVQLWTVRDAMTHDTYDILKAIKKIGYTDVENAGYNEGSFYNYPVEDFKKMLSDIGLKMRSAHVPLGWNTPDTKRTMANDWEAVCEDHAKLGVQYVVCPWFQHEDNLDKYKRLAELCNQCGEMAKKYNLQFAYHNHDFEFKQIDGQRGYDILLGETDADFVDFQLDLYWIKKGGADTLEYFEKHTNRFSLWHVKDMDPKDSFFTEVGNGIIDWASIFAERQKAGMEYFYVEQDDCRNYSPLKSIEISHGYMSGLNVG
jgi:sugar phosphate isomerase/epimerase